MSEVNSADKTSPALADSLRPRGPVHLEVSEEARPGETVLRAIGEVDVMTVQTLADSLSAAVRQTEGDVVVDLSETTFLDSTGLHVLLGWQRRLAQRSRSLRVICGQGPVRQVIETARLVETLHVSPA